MKQHPIRSAVLGIVSAWCLLAIGSCQSPQTPFEREEFIGTWRFSADSRVFLKKSFAALNPWFELKPDGTFIAVDLPQSLFFVRGKWQEFIMRGHGTWELGTHQNRPIVRLNYTELENFTFMPNSNDHKGESSFRDYLHIYHSRSDFYLFYYDADPDMGREMRFRKDNSRSGRTERDD